jgi:hypothetical protein
MTQRMTQEPSIVTRPAQPYAAVKGLVTMDTIPAIADRIPDVFAWLGERGITPGGPPFLRYDVIDMARQLEVEAGVPVVSGVDGEGDVCGAVLPEGRYVTVTHVGHPRELVGVTTDLLAWASGRGLAWDVSRVDAGDRWGCRLEVFKTNPAEEPDMSRFEAELVFRLAD